MTPRPFHSSTRFALSRPTVVPAILLAALVSSSAACSWSRFDDIKENVPVVMIENPSDIPGFATTMATVPEGNNTRMLVLGEPNHAAKAAAFSITSDDPSTSPVDTSFCDGRCLFGDTPAPMRSFAGGDGTHTGCFVLGVGERQGIIGLVGRCADGVNFSLPVPGPDPRYSIDAWPQDVITNDLFSYALGNQVIGDFKVAASPEEAPLVAAATKSLGASWYYPFGSVDPIILTPVALPGEDLEDPRLILGDSYGTAVAVASVSQGGHLIAIAAPRGVGSDPNGRVWLYREIDGKIVHNQPFPELPKPIGCLPGLRPNFGTYLHTGQLLGDGSDELFVSDGKTISIYDAGALASAPPTVDCAGPPLGANGYVTGIRCAENGSVTGCAYVTSGFGRSIAFGDVNGDGETELLVGAGTLDVAGTQGAGAVLVYHVDPTGEQTRLVEAKFLSSGSSGDALGTSVAALRIGSRDVVAAGAPGLGSFFLFYCSSLGGAGQDSSRCK